MFENFQDWFIQLVEDKGTMWVIGQIFGLVISVFGFFVYFAKNRNRLLVVKLCYDFCSIAQSIMISALTGALINGVAVFREIVFFNRDKHKWASYRIWLYVFVVLMGASPALTWQGLPSILPAIGSALAVIGFYCRDTHHTRIIGLFAQSFWLAYTILIPNIGGIIANIIQLTAATLGLIRDHRDKKKAATVAAEQTAAEE